MKTRSAKAKGRRLQNHVVEELREKYSRHLSKEDIKPAIMGESGVDIKLSPLAQEKIPFDIECKNVESLNVWGALAQAEENSSWGRTPLVVFTRNRSDVYCALKFDDLLRLL